MRGEEMDGFWWAKRTLGIELQDVDVAVRVRGNDVQLLPIRQEIRSQDLDVLRRFAENAQLVRILRVAREPDPLDRIAHHAQAGAFELLRGRDVALHVHEGDGQQRAVLLETSHHAFLALGGEEEALGADFG